MDDTDDSLQLVAEKSEFGEIGFYKAYQIAKENDSSVNHFSEFKNGYFL